MTRKEVLEKVKEGFDKELPARALELDEDDIQAIKHLQLLTLKPILYVANVGEDDLMAGEDNEYVKALQEYADREGAKVIKVCARIEEEISQLEDEEKAAFLEELGIKESGLVHISQLKEGFVSDVNEVVKLHQHVQVKVLEVDQAKKRLQLTMILV